MHVVRKELPFKKLLVHKYSGYLCYPDSVFQARDFDLSRTVVFICGLFALLGCKMQKAKCDFRTLLCIVWSLLELLQ